MQTYSRQFRNHDDIDRAGPATLTHRNWQEKLQDRSVLYSFDTAPFNDRSRVAMLELTLDDLIGAATKLVGDEAKLGAYLFEKMQKRSETVQGGRDLYKKASAELKVERDELQEKLDKATKLRAIGGAL